MGYPNLDQILALFRISKQLVFSFLAYYPPTPSGHRIEEIPNCRAIREGVTPALKAARTAFNMPCVKGTETASTFLSREISSEAGSFLPRRFRSESTAASNRSSS